MNRQFKGWLKSRGVEFTEQEVPDMAHVWPLWRQNLTDMVPAAVLLTVLEPPLRYH